MTHYYFPQPVLNSASMAEECRAEVAALLQSAAPVTLALATVDRITPSFANTFMMQLLDQFGEEYLRQNLIFEPASPWVTEALARSVKRHRSGIRLSDQRPA